MNTAIDKSIYGQIKTKSEQLAELVKMAEDIQNNNDKNAAEAYQQGLDDAWEAARKIVTWPDRSLVNSDTFDLDPGENIFTKYSASRAIEKLKAYEEKQDDKIDVGDEVTPKRNVGWKGVVVGIDDDNAMVMTSDGYSAMYQIEILCKTGRHFDIASILEDMRND